MKPVAIITGASSGIGASLAIEAAKRGYNLGIIARNTERLENIADIAREIGSEVFTYIGDISNEQECNTFIKKCLEKFERIDVLINNAGISMRAKFQNTHPEVIESVMNTNFWGTVYCTKAALPTLLKYKGTVVGISSIAGFKGLPYRTGYSASKFAMHGFLESLQCENLTSGLRVLIACPGYTRSNIRKSALDFEGNEQNESPLDENKLMDPDLVAIAVWKSIQRNRKYKIFTLKGKILLWINKWFPRIADSLVFHTVSRESGSPIH